MRSATTIAPSLLSPLQLPPVTRGYVTLCVLTTAACALEVRCRRQLGSALLQQSPAAAGAGATCLLPPAPTNPHPPQIITPFNIYFNSKLIMHKHEFWRIFTNFFYFGNLGARGRGRRARHPRSAQSRSATRQTPTLLLPPRA